MLDFLVHTLVHEQMADARRRAARQWRLSPGMPPRPRPRQGVLRRLLNVISISVLHRRSERRASQ
jgi:hypothetical protein